MAQGSPASPVLSNLVFKNIDTTFSKFAQENSIRFTRYADDLVFSGTEFFPNELPKIVRTVIEANDWQLADGKEHFSKLPFRLQVHGLLVHHANPRLTKGYRNLLRAFRHLIDNDRVQESDISKLKGHLAYAKSIDKFPLS